MSKTNWCKFCQDASNQSLTNLVNEQYQAALKSFIKKLEININMEPTNEQTFALVALLQDKGLTDFTVTNQLNRWQVSSDKGKCTIHLLWIKNLHFHSINQELFDNAVSSLL
jgi:hypothetical protein